MSSENNSMFSMTYTGLVRPNLLKGTSAEWSEWRDYYDIKYYFAEPMSNYMTACLSMEYMIDYDSLPDAMEGLYFIGLMEDGSSSWNYQLTLFKKTALPPVKTIQVCQTVIYESSLSSWANNIQMAGINIAMSRANGNMKFRIRKLKLELGTTPTPWCKHVDD